MRPCLFGELSIYKHHRMILPALSNLYCYAMHFFGCLVMLMLKVPGQCSFHCKQWERTSTDHQSSEAVKIQMLEIISVIVFSKMHIYIIILAKF